MGWNTESFIAYFDFQIVLQIGNSGVLVCYEDLETFKVYQSLSL